MTRDFYRVVSFIVPLLHAYCASGQFTVNNAVNAADGVSNILLGAGVTVSNITFGGNNAQIGGFTCASNCNLGIPAGLVIGTGNVNGSDGPNNSGSYNLAPPNGPDGTYDPDLDQLTVSDLNNVARLEFDFIPTGDSMSFDFVFASEEYPEYSDNPIFNDVFGFFLSGPGIAGPYQNGAENIALLPNGLPISINNVNPTNNSQFYNTNNGNAIQADGFTDVLTAFAEVECGQTYHIKIVIADAYDDLWDSWVFLEANSFESNQVSLNYVTPEIAGPADGLLEGCSSAQLSFSRSGNVNQSFSIPFELSGTANSGADYIMNPPSLSFQPGQTNIIVDVVALNDGINEGPEQIVITYLANGCAGSEWVQLIDITDLQPLSVPNFDVVIPCNEQAVLSPMPNGGAGLYEYTWPDGSNQDEYILVSPTDNETITVWVSDTCGVESVAVSASVAFIQQEVMGLDVINSGTPLCGEIITLSAIVTGGLPPYSFAWETAALPVSNTSSLDIQLTSDSSVSLWVVDQCGSEIFFDSIVAPQPQNLSVDLGDDIITNCLNTISLSPTVFPDYGGLQYVWNSGSSSESNASVLEINTAEPVMVSVVVSDVCGNAGADDIELLIPDPLISVSGGDDIQGNCLGNYELIADVAGSIGNVSYQWLIHNDEVANTPGLIIPTDSSYAIVISVTDQCNGEAFDTVLFVLMESPVSINLPFDTVIDCLTNLTLDPEVIGGYGTYSYTWYDEGGSVVSVVPSYSATYSEVENEITLWVEDECENFNSATISVLVPPAELSVIIPQDTIANCITPLNLAPFVSGGVGSYSYSWSDSAGNSLSTSSIYSELYQSQVSVNLFVSDECGNTFSQTVFIDMLESQIAIELTSDTLTNCLNTIQFNPLISGGIGAYDYSWILSNGSEISSLPQFTGIFADSEGLTLEVIDQCGGFASHTVSIEVPEVPVFIDIVSDTVTDCISMLELIPIVSGGLGGLSFQWSDIPGSVLTTDSIFSDIVSATQSLSFLAIDACGNAAAQTVDISLPEVPITISLVSDTSVNCLSQLNLMPIIMGGVGDYSFEWLNTAGFILSNDPFYISSYDSNSTILLSVNDQCGNEASAMTSIIVPDAPVYISALTDTVIDCVTPLTLSALVSGGIGGYNYEWLNAESGDVSTSADFTNVYPANTLVQLSVSDQCSNEAFAEIFVQVPPVQIFIGEIPDVVSTCIDEVLVSPVVNGGVGDYTFQWMQNGDWVASGNALNALVSETSSWMLMVNDACGNFSEESFTVSIPPIPVYVELGENIVTDCITSNTLYANVSGGVGGFTYAWTDDNGYAGNSSALDYVASNGTSIQLTVTDQCGNQAVDNMVIMVPAVPIFVTCPSDTTICRDDMIQLNASASGGIGDLTFIWSGFEEFGNSPYVFPSNDSNVYNVSVIDQCGNAGYESYTVHLTTVDPLFEVNTDDEISYSFHNVSEFADHVFWQFSSGESYFNEDFITYQNSSSDVWSVTLTAVRENGCMRSVTREFRPVTVFYIPNAFTPDGDGINDVFMPVVSDIVSYSCRIYNRLGQLIYQSDDIEVAWSGGATDGEYYLENGIYLYVIDAVNSMGKTFHVEGSVLMSR